MNELEYLQEELRQVLRKYGFDLEDCYFDCVGLPTGKLISVGNRIIGTKTILHINATKEDRNAI